MKKLNFKILLILISLGQMFVFQKSGEGQSWTAMGTYLNGPTYAIGWSGSNLIAGGYYFEPGGNGFSSMIDQWNGSSWSTLNYVDMIQQVNALTTWNSKLVVGGAFDGAAVGNPPSFYIWYLAQWNGSSWSLLDNSLSGTVRALAANGSTTLYVGGDFVTSVPPSTQLNYIGKWNGSSWSQLGSGMNGSVYALAMYGGNLYAGGSFTQAGGNSISYIAKWNGSSWSALGTGVNGTVNALHVFGSYLYVGGNFTTAGGNTVNYIAQWDGTSWSAYWGGVNNTVYCLSDDGVCLYAGGNFTKANGNTANYVAYEYSDLGWQSLGTGTSNGTNGTVFALAPDASNTHMYVGGSFTQAGGISSDHMAKWTIQSGRRVMSPNNQSNADLNATVNVYPNPSSGLFSVDMQNGSEKATIKVYSLLGEKVTEVPLNNGNNEMDLSKESKGIYLYQIITEGGNLLKNGKLVLQ